MTISHYKLVCGCSFIWTPELMGVRASGFACESACAQHSLSSPGRSSTHDALNKASIAAHAAEQLGIEPKEVPPMDIRDFAARGAKVEPTKAQQAKPTDDFFYYHTGDNRHFVCAEGKDNNICEVFDWDRYTAKQNAEMIAARLNMVLKQEPSVLPVTQRVTHRQRAIDDAQGIDAQWANALITAFKKCGLAVDDIADINPTQQAQFDLWADGVVSLAKQQRILHDNRVKPEQRDQEWRDCLRRALSEWGRTVAEDTKSIELPTAGPAVFAFVDIFTSIYNMGHKEGVAKGVVTGVVNPVLDLCERDRALLAEAAQLVIERYEGVISKLDKIKVKP